MAEALFPRALQERQQLLLLLLFSSCRSSGSSSVSSAFSGFSGPSLGRDPGQPQRPSACGRPRSDREAYLVAADEAAKK